MLNKFWLIITITLLCNNSFALKKLNVLLDWQINPDHAPLVIAKEQGFFAKKGIEINLIEPADPADPPKLIATKRADIAITYQPNYMIQVDRKLPVIAIGSLIDQPLNCLVALKNNHIHQLSDLKGKKIATSNNGLSSLILKSMLKHAGLDPTQATFIHVRYNLNQALISKQVAAANGMMRNIEVPVLESKNIKLTTFYPEDYGIPAYHELIFIRHLQDAHNADTQKFMHAIKEAKNWLHSHPEEGWQIFIKHYPHTNNEMNKKAWFATMPYFSKKNKGIKNESWQEFGQFLYSQKLISRVQSNHRYYVTK